MFSATVEEAFSGMTESHNKYKFMLCNIFAISMLASGTRKGNTCAEVSFYLSCKPDGLQLH